MTTGGVAATIRLTVDGRRAEVPAGSTVAAAVWRANAGTARRALDGSPRGPVCGMGVCFECRVEVDGPPDVRSCMVRARDGMDVRTTRASAGEGAVSATRVGDHAESAESITHPPTGACDVLVVGAGPAGLAAAATAAEGGADVVIVDGAAHLGGQIWRPRADGSRPAQAEAWVDRVADHPAIDARLRTSVVGASAGADGPTVVLASDGARATIVRPRRLILATGARERFLPFPGWTLPGVVGVGGAQALASGGVPIGGRTVVVAGSGPLALAVAAHLAAAGAHVVAVAEQADAANVRRFAATMAARPATLARAALLRLAVGPGRYRPGTWPVAAHGLERVDAVSLRTAPGADRTIDCDLLAVAFGLEPELRLAALLGCRHDARGVVVDDRQRTTAAGVLAAGEITGVGGADMALVEGRIAADAAAGRDVSPALAGARDRGRRFADLLERAFALRPELRDLPDADTVVCRCEDVRLGALSGHSTWRSAKLHTRCGMGPCQGRVCGPATTFLFGWEDGAPRPPLEPLSVSAMIQSHHMGVTT